MFAVALAFFAALALFRLGLHLGFRLPSRQRIGTVAKQLQTIERAHAMALRSIVLTISLASRAATARAAAMAEFLDLRQHGGQHFARVVRVRLLHLGVKQLAPALDASLDARARIVPTTFRLSTRCGDVRAHALFVARVHFP